ncbi:MAG: FtsX-like permease family protein [Coriobacteriia bacterium]|nr:FtsX-like permease family protein [Coriobacteriia bacterium]
MRCPLSKRHLRELRHNLGRYIGIFALLASTIAMVAGFLVGASSIERIFATIPETYHTENGHFVTNDKIGLAAKTALSDIGVEVKENFSREITTQIDGRTTHVRVFPNREDFNLPAIYDGRLPEGPNEIAIDDTFLSKHSLKLGDSIRLDGKDFTIVGDVVLSDYTALFEKNEDFVMNTLTFTVALVTRDDWNSLEGDSTSYTYAYFVDGYDDMTTAEHVDKQVDIARALTDSGARVTDIVDMWSNQAFFYAGEDVSHDQAIYRVLLYLIIIVMAFIFVVLTAATIEEESAVIGTLLASGYRKGELLRHYLFLPAAVGLAACIVGNVVGYGVCVTPFSGLYYNSYSFPPLSITFNPSVFLITTVIPFAILVLVNLVGLAYKLKCTPIQFLRHDTRKHRKARRGLQLPERWGYIARFRIRVFTRNLSQFGTLFGGILIASLLLLFGLGMRLVISDYVEDMENDLPAQYIYSLKAPLEIDDSADKRAEYVLIDMLGTGDSGHSDEQMNVITGNLLGDVEDVHPVNVGEIPDEVKAQAEKVVMGELELAHKWGDLSETITVYGIQEDSRYWPEFDVSNGAILAGTGLVAKCNVAPGETYGFFNKYAGETYDLTVTDTVGEPANTNLYMSIETFNRVFDNDPEYFSGYVSDEELNLDATYVASVLTPDDMRKIANQMDDSMGDLMNMVVGMAVVIYFIMMYLLTKTVIDRSARSISYMKVFGYRDREINKLYVRSITITVIVSLIVSLPIVIWTVSLFAEVVFMNYSGNFAVNIPFWLMAESVGIGVATYLVVALFHIRAIKRVRLEEALKVQE